MLETTQAYGLTFLYPKNDETIGPSLKVYGEFSKVAADLIVEYLGLSTAGAFIDIGANIGSICVPVAARFPDRRVIAVEGHRGLAQVLGTNGFANGLFNLEANHAVAGAKIGLSRFPAVSLSTAGNFGSLGVKDVGAGNRESIVRVCTVDEIAPADTAVIKIDVEGFEPEVLAGAARTLEKIRPVWLIEAASNFEDKSRAAISVMLEHGYDCYWLFVPFVTRTAERGVVPRDLKGDVNFVAVPPGGPNPWGLKPIRSAQDPLPSALADMPYLARFGYDHVSWGA